jgi:pyruvate dehydrogenase E2 component (dihydrolipoamide acetyltransferase)
VVPGVPSAAAPDVPANGLANGLAQAGRTPSAAQVTTAGPAASGSGPGPGSGSGQGVPRALSTPRSARPDGVGRPVLAKPPVRKVARDLGVDLAMVTGSGPAGTITRLDVETAAAGTATPAATPAPAPAPAPAPVPTADGGRTTDGTPGAAAGGSTEDHPRPTGVAGQVGQVGQVGLIPPGAVFDPATRTWRVAVSGVRRATARAMVASAFTAPQVTEFLAADLTATLAARDRLSARPEFAGVKVTPLLFTARALLVAIRRHPMINSSWVEAEHGDQRIVVHEAVNLGIAVASPRGLLVPNIPDAGRLGFAELAHALQNLASQARSGRSTPADLSGGTITITNVGVFGVDSGTPILNPGEAAILALGAVRPAPWVHEGNLAVRTVGQLSLSFDHRLVDGELGSAVLADVAAMLTDPTLLLAWS